MKRHLFEEAKEIEIQAEPQAIMPMVDVVARELSSHNFHYEARGVPTQQPEVTFVWYNVLVIEPGKVGAVAKRPIGAFTLHKLEGNRTMLTWLPRSKSGIGNLTPMELSIIAYSGDEYDEYFCQFIKSLENRLVHCGLKVTWCKKLWREVKDFIATIIAKFMAEKSK